MDEQEKHRIPKFGDWEGENIAFTYYFEKTRQIREGKLNSLPNSKTASPVKSIAQDGIQSEAEKSSLSSHYHLSNASPRIQKSRHNHSSPKIRLVEQKDEIRDKQPTIPKFGEWEDSDPSTGDGFTEKFDRVRKENKNAENGAVVKSQEDPNFAIVYTIPEKKKSPKVKKPLGKCFSCFGC
ncbi:hypothetical protein ZOSMA_34G01050 [Zostera marina]|uniref:RIN4 pathogenic type III effector avirulence factor Avr cleavage site domain-containing protein n=1 Tax=Zostera marina TaxID=29655 RepID=A0A0K9P9G0_ZOSMR|nr:hypothetical protein ZOSMA_34G01050 [Zostera marina]